MYDAEMIEQLRIAGCSEEEIQEIVLEDQELDRKCVQALTEEWLRVLARLWQAINKPIDAEQLELYRRELGEIPLGLLELAVSRAIRDNGKYQTVPTIGAIWEALKAELGNPWDVRQEIDRWVEQRWQKSVIYFGQPVAVETEIA